MDNNFASPEFWDFVNESEDLENHSGVIDFSKKDTSGVLLDIYNEREKTFSDSTYFCHKDVDQMRLCAIRLLLKICSEGSAATGPNPTYWYNAQIQAEFEFSSLLKRAPETLNTDEEDLLWNECLKFFESWYSGPRYIYRQSVLWAAISEDFKLFGELFPSPTPDEIIYMNFFTRFLAAHIGTKMRNVEGD